MSKVSVTYHAPAGDNRVVDMGGHTFFDGQALDVEQADHPALVSKLRTNQHFEVVGGEPEADPTSNELIAKHKGRGVYSIVRGDVIVVEGLSGDEAKNFNAMTDEAKDDYVRVALEEAPPAVA